MISYLLRNWYASWPQSFSFIIFHFSPVMGVTEMVLTTAPPAPRDSPRRRECVSPTTLTLVNYLTWTTRGISPTLDSWSLPPLSSTGIGLSRVWLVAWCPFILVLRSIIWQIMRWVGIFSQSWIPPHFFLDKYWIFSLILVIVLLILNIVKL